MLLVTLCGLASVMLSDAAGPRTATRVAAWLQGNVAPASALAFDRTNPFFWDNDTELDVFTLAFLLAATSNGDIRLIGMSRSPNPYAPERDQAEFSALVRAAIDSGWNVPRGLLSNIATDLGADYMTALERPPSARIDDTRPIDRRPAQLMRDLVLARGTTTTPVVIGAGGPLTTVA